MSDAYDLRSNMKDKPGSQGTLFQVKDKGLLNPQQRWPRGYTPERRDEIAGALKDTVIMDRVSHPVRSRDPEDWEQGRYARYPHAEARVVDTLARSTVPASDIQGLERIHDKPHTGHLATYWPAKKEMAVTMFGSRPTSTGRSLKEEGEHSLIHELGHHVDKAHTGETERHMQQGVAAKVEYATPGGPEAVRSGLAEGVADNYYVEHFRGRGRKRERVTQGHYETNFAPDEIRRKYPGYTHVRPTPEFSNLNGAQFQGTLF